MFGNVLVALRDPSMAHPALEEAADLAAGGDARLTVLFVVGEVAAGWFDIASEGGDRDPERLASLRLAAERQVAEALARLPWVPEVRTEVVEGPFGPAVAERVGLGDFDAVVIEAGGRGRGGRLSASAELFRLLGGEAPPAVLLVPTPPDASATGREGRD